MREQSVEYRCLYCAYQWVGKAGPVACPECGGIHVEQVDPKEKARGPRD